MFGLLFWGTQCSRGSSRHRHSSSDSGCNMSEKYWMVFSSGSIVVM